MRGWVALALALSPALGAGAAETPALGRLEANEGARPASAVAAPAPSAAGQLTAGVGETANPLASIPLSALSETRNRPLFAVTRRPPPAIISQAPAANATPANSPSERERAPFSLVGTIVGLNAGVAILMDPTTNRVMQVRQGRADSGWTVQSVGARSIVLQKGALIETVQLPHPDGPSPVTRTGEAAR